MFLTMAHGLTMLAALSLGAMPQQPTSNNKTKNNVQTSKVSNVQKNMNGDIVKSTGEYAKIDVQLLNDTLNVFANGTAQQKQTVAKRIMGHADKYAPVALCAFAKYLYDAGKKDDATFWYYAGTLRSRYDAKRCTDETVGDAIAAVNNRYGSSITEYSLQYPTKLETIATKIIDWDRTTPYNYDHRWINLQGTAAAAGNNAAKSAKIQPLSVSKSTWKQLAENNRSEFFAEIHKNVENAKARTSNGQ